MSRELIESRLFGHRKGAFTGATGNQQGVIRAAAEGTLLLDEIGELSLEAQGALLRFLQSGEIQPVGEGKPVKVDARVIAATNCDLWRQVEAGRFRKDLYYRLNVATVCVPPLKDRREDVPELARHFAGRYSQQYGLSEPVLSEEEARWLASHDWPGNVRELENAVKRRVLFGPGTLQETHSLRRGDESRQEASTPGAVEPDRQADESPGLCWRGLSEAEKRQLLTTVLAGNNGNVSAAARELGIDRRTIQLIRKRMNREVA